MHRALVRALLVLLPVLLFLAVASNAVSASSSVVVGQVYAGGGNAGATYTNDFVELFNRGSTAVDLSAWSLQYASAASASWTVTPLVGTVAPGHYYLVALGSTAQVGSPLPAADATDTTNLAASGGKVALVASPAALTCGVSAGSCVGAAGLADLVGYGSAADYEGSGPAPALDSVSAAVRAGDGCTDTDDNAADFAKATPSPRSSASAALACAGSPPEDGGSASATVGVDVQSSLSLSLERTSLSFGPAQPGTKPASVSEGVTVASNSATGYSLSVHRTAFAPADLPLGLASTAPSGGTLGSGLAGGTTAAIPIAPASDLVIGTTAGPSGSSGDLWPASVGFTAGLPAVATGHYTAQITFTVVAR